ncbi:hypothetical protein BDN67DRAFT_899297, partial [Paxillus ammoniavirescens]
MAATTVLAPPITTSLRSPSPVSSTHDNSSSQRHSFVSSTGASFFTARASPLTPTSPNPFEASSRSSSTQTLNGNASNNHRDENPMQLLSKQVAQNIYPQELHFVKVTGETVELESSPASNSVFHSVNKTVMHVVSSD